MLVYGDRVDQMIASWFGIKVVETTEPMFSGEISTIVTPSAPSVARILRVPGILMVLNRKVVSLELVSTGLSEMLPFVIG